MIKAASSAEGSDSMVLGPCHHISSTPVLTPSSLVIPTQSPRALWNLCLFSWLMGMSKSQTLLQFILASLHFAMRMQNH